MSVNSKGPKDYYMDDCIISQHRFAICDEKAIAILVKLSAKTTHVYLAIALHASIDSKAWPSYASIASIANVGRSSVRRHLALLEENRLIKRLTKPGKGTVYTLVTRSASEPSARSASEPTSKTTRSASEPLLGAPVSLTRSAHEPQTDKEQTKEQINKPSPPTECDSSDVEKVNTFDLFWESELPKKTEKKTANGAKFANEFNRLRNRYEDPGPEKRAFDNWKKLHITPEFLEQFERALNAYVFKSKDPEFRFFFAKFIKPKIWKDYLPLKNKKETKDQSEKINKSKLEFARSLPMSPIEKAMSQS